MLILRIIGRSIFQLRFPLCMDMGGCGCVREGYNIGTDTLLEYIIKGLFQKSHPLCCVPRNTDEQRVPLRNKWDSFFILFVVVFVGAIRPANDGIYKY